VSELREPVLRLLLEAPRTPLEIARLGDVPERFVKKALRALVDEGLISQQADRFGLRSDARSTLAVDLAERRLRVGLGDLGGLLLNGYDAPLRSADPFAHIAEAVEAVRAGHRAGRHPIEVIVVSSPGVIDANGLVSLADGTELDGWALGHELAYRTGIPVVIENDVNLAALGERVGGAAVGIDDVAVLSVGRGIGLGIISDGQLRRGARGFAGEVAWLPLGPNPAAREIRRTGSAEMAMNAAAMRDLWIEIVGGPDAAEADQDLAEILDDAAADDRRATRLVDRHAELVAKVVLSVAVVLDPALVVLRGSIGAHKAYVGPVRESVARLAPFEIRIERSTTPEAGVLGGLFVGAERTRRALLSGADPDRAEPPASAP
jgi:glucokinase